MNEVQVLFASEPCKPLKSRSLNVIFLVEKNVRVKRRCACGDLRYEKVRRQDGVCTRSDQQHRNKEEGCIVAFVSEVHRGDEMIFGIVGVMKVNVVAEEPAAHGMVTELVMHERLRKGHDQMRDKRSQSWDLSLFSAVRPISRCWPIRRR